MSRDANASGSGATSEAAGDTPEGPVLVVGGAGYIGSHTVRLLEERGVPVVVYDDLSTGHRDAVGGPFVRGDLADRERLAHALREWQPKAILHFAARCSVGESVVDPALYYRENVINGYNLLEEMRAAACTDLVFSSSCATYGVPERVPIDELNHQHPVNPYGRTKLHMEHMLSDYARAYGMRYAALRYFNAAGASSDGRLGEDHEPESHLIPLVLQVAAGRRDEIHVFGDDYDTPDGTCIRDYVHVVDLADAHLRALCRLQAGDREILCNLGSGAGYSVLEVIETVRRVTGHPIPMRMMARRPGDPPQLVSGGGRAHALLGWQPQRSGLEQIVRDAWHFMQSNPAGYAD
jgi:UDP-glucose 4-epimerase